MNSTDAYLIETNFCSTAIGIKCIDGVVIAVGKVSFESS